MPSLSIFEDELAICSLQSEECIPEVFARSSFCSYTRTRDGISLIVTLQHVPEGVEPVERWRALQLEDRVVLGQRLDLAWVAKALSEANIDCLALSTFSADYVLVRSIDLHSAAAALRSSGCTVR
jgi:hypothetical protein